MLQTRLIPPAQDPARFCAPAAWAFWVCFILLLALISSGKKTFNSQNSVVPAYRQASLEWMHSQPIYHLLQIDGDLSVHGFLYLPASAVITAPLATLPAPAHEFAFRWLSIALLAWSLYRLARAILPRYSREAFLIMTLCAIAPCAGPAKAGQMNIVLAASMALAIADGIDRRWWWSAFWLGLGFALKPQGIVLAALVIALCPPLRVRGTLAILAAFALPFLFQSPAYVVEQYQLCLQKLHHSSRPSEAGVHDSDLSGLLGALGIQLSENIRWALRLLAAGGTLAVSWLAVRRGDRGCALTSILAFASVYLMLFNPRTEGGSYIILAVPLGAFLVHEIARRHVGRAGFLIALSLGWGLSYNLSLGIWMLLHRLRWTHTPDFRGGFGPYWFSPALAILFMVYLLIEMTRSAKAAPIPPISPQKQRPAQNQNRRQHR